MATIVIEDLISDQALDRRAMAAVIGGGHRFGGFGWMRPYRKSRPAPGLQPGGSISQTIYDINYTEINNIEYNEINVFNVIQLINAGGNVDNSGYISNT